MAKTNAAKSAASGSTSSPDDPPQRRSGDASAATAPAPQAAASPAPEPPDKGASVPGPSGFTDTGSFHRVSGIGFPPTPPGGQPPGGQPPEGGGHGRHHPELDPKGRRLGLLTLTALGVVYGDIGTSPLYAFRECFNGAHAVPGGATPVNVYGVLSLIVWALTLVVSIKYVVFIMRADNRGEGGILALLALILQRQHREGDWLSRKVLVALGLFGAALLYGDGVITPPVSVLGAMEGLDVISNQFQAFIVPGTVVILFLLFFFQRFGTARVGTFFGPIMVAWFVTIALLGLHEVAGHWAILWHGINPLSAVWFFREHGFHAVVILGSVVLAVTGAEALYADMGHFGRKPIRMAWAYLVFPCLLLNYFGQGALLLRDPAAAENPFYHMAPQVLLLPLLVLATMAAIIASQALISGAFSLTQQSMQLGYSPRVTIVHTSAREAGQIYIPEINKALAVGCIAITIMFQTTARLAAAYGIAVTGTMAITTILFYVIARTRWDWSVLHAGALATLFLVVDLAFFGANLLKFAQGGWVPLSIAVFLFVLMTTWKRGRDLLQEILHEGTVPLDMFLDDIGRKPVHRVKGTAVFMTSNQGGAPVVMMHHLKHNKVLHEQVVLLSVLSAEVPETVDEERYHVEKLQHGFYRVRATYGFMETPNVKEIMAECAKAGIKTGTNQVSYYLGRERLIVSGKAKMARWRKKVFIFMSRNARSATEFFGIPPNRAVELGAQIEF